MQKWNTFHILNVYFDKTQPNQFKYNFKLIYVLVGYGSYCYFTHLSCIRVYVM